MKNSFGWKPIASLPCIALFFIGKLYEEGRIALLWFWLSSPLLCWNCFGTVVLILMWLNYLLFFHTARVASALTMRMLLHNAWMYMHAFAAAPHLGSKPTNLSALSNQRKLLARDIFILHRKLSLKLQDVFICSFQDKAFHKSMKTVSFSMRIFSFWERKKETCVKCQVKSESQLSFPIFSFMV